jgi:anti-sigma regulatory factor (Ser/Thr protein kinase)
VRSLAADRRIGAVLGIMTLQGRPEDVAGARAFVARTLRHRPDAATAVLLSSELVTNSIVHGAGSVTVLVLTTPRGVRIEVTDDGSASVPRLREPGTADEGGRGLLLIDSLAARWDHVRDESGLTSWFEL